MAHDKVSWIHCNPLCRKGAEKTSTSCKSKWGKLKKIYDAVRKMKEPPGISGLTWDDEKGMNITKKSPPGTQAVWAKYVRSNKLAADFATSGWAHYESMDLLLSMSKDRGDRSHQPLLEAMRTTPSSSSTRLNIPSSSSASSKRKLFDGILSKLSDTINHYFDPAKQSTSATVPAPTPGASPESPQMKAIDLLVKDIKVSKQGGDQWLSEDDLMKVAMVFRGDPKSAEIYIAFANSSGSILRSREWIRQLL